LRAGFAHWDFWLRSLQHPIMRFRSSRNEATGRGRPIGVEVAGGGGAIELCPGESPNQISLDVQPDEEPNAINGRKRGVIAAALLATASFDATGADPRSVAFGSAGAPEAHGRGHLEDIDGSGELDLVLHFAMAATGLACEDERVALLGQTFGGEWIEGSDAIVPVGCRQQSQEVLTPTRATWPR
jgi:hypothetical protein